MIRSMLCIQDPVLQKGWGVRGVSYQRHPMLICPITGDFNFLKIEMCLTHNIILVSGVQHPSPQILILFFFLQHVACGISVPHPGTEPGPWQWKPRILTSKPPRNSLQFFSCDENFNIYCLSNFQIYNTVLLSVVTVLHIISPGLPTGSLYLFTPFVHFTYSHLLPW